MPDIQPPQLLVTGNPVDGFGFVGPFEDTEAVSAYAERNRISEWWSCDLTRPDVGSHRDFTICTAAGSIEHYSALNETEAKADFFDTENHEIKEGHLTEEEFHDA